MIALDGPTYLSASEGSKKFFAASKNAGNCGRAGQVKWREGKSESCSRAGRCIWSQIVVLPFLKPGKTFEHYRKWKKKLGAERTDAMKHIGITPPGRM